MLLMLLLALRSAASLVAPRPSSLLRAPARARAASLGDYFALPAEASAALAARGIEVAAPAQEAFWSSSHDGPGAAKGESACLHAPTGSGKTLAMLLPAVARALWGGAPRAAGSDRRLALRRGDPFRALRVLEHAPDLYGALNVEALVLDELDLLMPARASSAANAAPPVAGPRAPPAEALAQLVAKRGVETLQVVAGSATLDRASRKKLDAVLRASPLVRAVADALGARAAGETVVLNDALFPSSQRNRRRGYADADAAEKKAREARERAMDSGGRDALSRAGAEELRAALGAATPAAPVVLVADQAA
ncbi:helicase [Aureococcus anophagefferens]|uniref:Helicase n=1 Tax=Aureococcus anophagefferens TaxID=44056 RepID=A0ABR1G835_AURAN